MKAMTHTEAPKLLRSGQREGEDEMKIKTDVKAGKAFYQWIETGFWKPPR